MNTSKYEDLFLEEIGGHLESIESALLTIEEKPSQSDVVHLPETCLKP